MLGSLVFMHGFLCSEGHEAYSTAQKRRREEDIRIHIFFSVRLVNFCSKAGFHFIISYFLKDVVLHCINVAPQRAHGRVSHTKM